MSEEVKKTEDNKSKSNNSNSEYKGKGANNNRQKRGPPLSPAQQLSLIHISEPTRPY